MLLTFCTTFSIQVETSKRASRVLSVIIIMHPQETQELLTLLKIFRIKRENAEKLFPVDCHNKGRKTTRFPVLIFSQLKSSVAYVGNI